MLDTNVLIDYTANRYTASFQTALRSAIAQGRCLYSTIAGTEALSGDIPITEMAAISELLTYMPALDFTEELMPLASTIRRLYKFKLPDAMIAATAVYYNYTLITADKRNFHLLDQLALIRPEIKD